MGTTIKRLLLFALLLSTSLVFGQGTAFPPNTAWRTVNGFLMPAAGATITVCPGVATGLPCAPATVSLYTDPTLSTPLSNPFTADSNGNYKMAIAAPLSSATYTVSITGSGLVGYSYQVSAGITIGNNVTINNATLTGTTTSQGITDSGLSTFKSLNLIKFASQFAGASNTGGIQEAINAVSPNGTVWVDSSVSASVAINMKADTVVRCSSPNVTITFTGATNGFVWPNSAHRAKLVDCKLLAGNIASAKAIDIEDGSAGAHDAVIDNVTIDSSNAPTDTWAYGVYQSNSLLERYDNLKILSATVPVHIDGVSNSTDFYGLNVTNNINSVTLADIQGGSPINFFGGEIEGNASGEGLKVTQPGAAPTTVVAVGLTIENANASGKGAHINVPVQGLLCYGCNFIVDGASGPTGFVFGDVSTTRYTKILGGQGTGWTVGANAAKCIIQDYLYSGPVVIDNSTTGTNTYFANNYATDTSFVTSSHAETETFSNGLNLPLTQAVEWGGNSNDSIFATLGNEVHIKANGNDTFSVDSTGQMNFTTGAGTSAALTSYLKAPVVKTPSVSNTDSFGSLTISASTSATYTFTGTYSNGPICTVTPQTDPTAAGFWWAGATSTTLTVNVKNSSTISFFYTCFPRP